MRTPTVNSFLLRGALLAAAVVTSACSSAEGRAPAVPASAAHNAATTPVIDANAQPGDSLSKRADLGRIDGAATAKVWVVEISDLQCPFCKRWHDSVYPKIRDEYVKTGKVRFAYINFPLSQHKNSFAAATAAMCASAQGKFWGMHDGLFTTQEKWEELSNPGAHFESLAAKAGVDMGAWKSCLPSSTIKGLIEADMDRAKSAGVESTPSFIVAGRLIEGAVPLEDLRKAINSALTSGK